MAIPYDSPEEFGKNIPERQPEQPAPVAGGAPASDASKEKFSAFEASGAKAYQSLTFGFGADVDEQISKGQGAKTRAAAHQFESDNPWTSLGIDMGAGVVQSMAPGLRNFGKIAGPPSAFNIAKSGAKVGAVMGGLYGAGSGGEDIGERASRALQGSVSGAVGGAALGVAQSQVAKLLGRGIESVPFQNLITPAANATKNIMSAIRASGKTLERVQRELEADPAKTLADVVPGMASILKKAQNTSESVQSQLKDNLQQKLGGTASRMEGGVKRAMNSIDDMIQDIQGQFGKLELGKNADYAQAHAEKAVLTPEIRNILSNPAVKSLMTTAQETTAGMIQAGKTPKVTLKPGESPVAFLDQVQRQIGTAIDAEKDPARKVLLTELKAKMNDELGKQSASLAGGQDAAKKLASYNDAKEDAMKWGMQFAKGVNNVDMKTFQAMSDPLQKAHAQFGFLNGLNDTYLSQVGNMTTQQIQNMKTALTSDMTKELLPLKYSTRINKMLDRELAFRKNAASISPKIERAEIAENRSADTMTYGVNKLLGGAVGSAMKLLNKAGMSEAQASQIVKLGASPEGLEMLKASGKFTNEFMNKMHAVAQMNNGLAAATTVNLTGTSKSSLKDMAESKD